MENGRRHQTGLRRVPHLLLFRWVWRTEVLLHVQNAMETLLFFRGGVQCNAILWVGGACVCENAPLPFCLIMFLQPPCADVHWGFLHMSIGVQDGGLGTWRGPWGDPPQHMSSGSLFCPHFNLPTCSVNTGNQAKSHIRRGWCKVNIKGSLNTLSFTSKTQSKKKNMLLCAGIL